ncbi:MAG TPA: transporter substrate-binding domain-containing protein [Cellvibrionaceae bacterium]
MQRLLIKLSYRSPKWCRWFWRGFILSHLLTPLSALAGDCIKTFRWSEDPPFTFASVDAPDGVSGISVDIVRAVLNSLGCEVTFVDMPWARALLALKSGKVDIVSGAFDIPARREFAYYANRGDTYPNLVFVRSDNLKATAWNHFSELLESDLTLGGQIGVNYGPDFQRALENLTLEDRLTLVPDRLLLWQMLDRGRIDAVAASYLTGLKEISNLGYQGRIVRTGIELSSDPAYFIFSKASVNKAFVDRFNKAYNSFLLSEDYQAIVDAHTREILALE